MAGSIGNGVGPTSWGSGWAGKAFKGGGTPVIGEKVKAAEARVAAGNRRAVFVPDHESFGEFILSDQVRKPVVEVAHAIAETARGFAPRRKSRGNVSDGTAMADSFEVNADAGFIKVGRNTRVKVEVFNEKRSAAPNEFGSQRNKRHRMLGRAGAAHGDFKGDL